MLHAKQRIQLLFDKNSFEEYDAFVFSRIDEKPIHGDGIIIGVGKINKRSVAIFAEDIQVHGGTSGEEHSKKLIKIIDICIKNKIPLIGFLASGGGRIQEGILSMEITSKALRKFIQLSGYVPTITVAYGACAGGAAYLCASSDFNIMVENESFMLLTGPKVVEKVLNQKTTKEELGGTSIHGFKTGNASFVVKNELSVFEKIKKLLSFLPQYYNADVLANKYKPSITDKRFELNTILPEQESETYDVSKIIHSLVDNEDLFEINELFAPNIITAFAQLGGRNIGIIANQSAFLGGTFDIDALKKSTRHQQICDAYNIPLLFLLDSPGIMPGVEQEQNGLITFGAKLFHILATLTVPRITLITRKAIGGAFGVMNPKGMGADYNLAWASAEIAVVGAGASLDIIYHKEALASNNPSEFMKQKKEDFSHQFLNPYVAAKYGFIDEVILPEDSRIKLIKAFKMLENKSENNLPKKRNIIPM